MVSGALRFRLMQHMAERVNKTRFRLCSLALKRLKPRPLVLFLWELISFYYLHLDRIDVYFTLSPRPLSFSIILHCV